MELRKRGAIVAPKLKLYSLTGTKGKCLRCACGKVAVATGDTLRQMWMFDADMPPTLQVVTVLVADRPGKLSWVQLSRSVGGAFGLS